MLGGFRSKGNIIDKVKDGKFVVTQYDLAIETLSFSAELSKFEPLTARMLLALHYVSSLRTFNKDVFREKYIENIRIIKQMKLDDFTDVFSSWIR